MRQSDAAPPLADLVLKGASRLVTGAPGVVPGAVGPLGVVERGALAARAGRILWCGPEAELPAAVDATHAAHVDAAGAAVIPGFAHPLHLRG
jgi:imidazolonepropionase-like amidohydrolase